MPPESRSQSDFSIPKDVLSEIQRHLPNGRGDLKVEAWKPSLVDRVFGFFGRDRERE